MMLPKILIKRGFLLIVAAIILLTFLIMHFKAWHEDSKLRRLKSLEFQAETTNICGKSDKEYQEICSAIRDLEKVYYKKFNFVVNYFDFKPWPNKPLCSKDINVLIAINSKPESIDWRRTVRRTFGSVSIGKPWPNGEVYTSVQLIFLVGKTFDKRRDTLINVRIFVILYLHFIKIILSTNLATTG